MKEKIIKLANHIYYGIYLYTGEAFYVMFYEGERKHYRGFWGFKLCYIMVFFYSFSIVSLFGYFIGDYAIGIVHRSFFYKLVFLSIILGISLFFARATSLEGEKGLRLIEQFIKEPQLEKEKWMIIGALCFLMGFAAFVLGAIVFPVF